MKVKTTLRPEDFRCIGRVKAKGKKAKPTFCYRGKPEGTGENKKTVTEFYSRVTGKLVGYYGGRTKPLVRTREEAMTLDSLNGFQVDSDFRWFMNDAHQKVVTDWNRPAKAGWKEILKEAKKQ